MNELFLTIYNAVLQDLLSGFFIGIVVGFIISFLSYMRR